MKKEAIQKILLHLEKKGLLHETITEDELMDKLYVNNDERKQIIKALISLFSEDYRTDLQRAVILDNELAQKMYELEFVTKENRLHFVLGKCSKEEQQAVYERMFKALHLVLIAQEPTLNNISSSWLTESLPNQDIQPSVNRQIKLTKKKFNLKPAIQNLEMAQKTLEDALQFIEQGKHMLFQQTSLPKLEGKENEESTKIELTSTAESFRVMMGRHNSLSSEFSEESNLLPAELGSAVSELHSILQFVADSTKSSPLDGTELRKKFDLEKMTVEANELDTNLITSQCFSKDITSND